MRSWFVACHMRDTRTHTHAQARAGDPAMTLLRMSALYQFVKLISTRARLCALEYRLRLLLLLLLLLSERAHRRQMYVRARNANPDAFRVVFVRPSARHVPMRA